jgi:hypothetical protein
MIMARDDAPNTILEVSEPEHQSSNNDENQLPIPPKKSPFSKAIARLRRHFNFLSLGTRKLAPNHKRGKERRRNGPGNQDSGLHMEAADSERKEESLAEGYSRAWKELLEKGDVILVLEGSTGTMI